MFEGRATVEMQVTNPDESVIDVRLTGRLDSPAVDSIELRFTASVVPHGKHAIVDLSGVSILTSMGLRMLITVAKALSAKHKTLAVYAPQAAVRTMLDGALLGQIIAIHPDRAAALATIRS